MNKAGSTESTFFSNLVFLIIINIIIKPFYVFGIDMAVQNRVGPEVFGSFIALLNFVYLFQIIGDAGMRSYNNRLIAEDPSRLKNTLKPSLYLKLLLSVAFIIITILTASIMGYADNVFMLFLIVLSQALNGILLFVRSAISGLGMYKWDSFISVLDKLIMIIICGLLLYLPFFHSVGFQLEWFVYAQVASFLFALLFGLFLLYRKKSFVQLLDFKWDQLKQYFWASLPYASIIFLMTIYTRIDVVMIKELLLDGEYQVGLYHAGFRILEQLHSLGLIFAGLLLPMFAANLKKKEEIEKLVVLGFNLLFSFAIPISVILFFYRYDVMNYFYVASDFHWGDTFGYIVLSYIGVAGMYVFSTLLTAAGETKILNWIFIFGTVINVVGNYFLISYYKAEGAAIMTLITQLFIMMANMYFVIKKYISTKIYFNLFIICLYLVIITLCSIFIKNNLDVNEFVQIVVLGVISLFVAVSLKIINISELKSLLIKSE